MEWLLDIFNIKADKAAIIDHDRIFTFNSLAENVGIYYKKIKTSIPESSTVALVSDYSFYSIAAFLALIRNKNIVSPLIDSTQAERDKKLEKGGIQYMINVDDAGNLAFTTLKPGSKSPLILDLKKQKHAGLILFSSGTTGEPKAMVHDLTRMVESYRDKRARNLRMLVFLMFDHIGGLNTLLNCLASTTTIVLTPARDPENICRLIEKHQVNILPTTPTFLNILLLSGAYEKYNLASLKLITYGTEFMPENLLVRLNAAFPRAKFLQTFGTSETGIAETQSFSSTSNLIKITGDEVQYKIVDGELYLKGKNQVLGYLSGDQSKFEAGWFKTGDVVEEAEGGYLRILSRMDDIINVGGEKVFPSEIENALLGFSFIKECVAYGLKNPITGETVALDVALIPGKDAKTAKKEIRKYCLQNLAPYKVPSKITFVEDIGVSSRFKKSRKGSL